MLLNGHSHQTHNDDFVIVNIKDGNELIMVKQ